VRYGLRDLCRDYQEGPWIEVLADIAAMPGNTPVSGVMTTDVKPRLWPRARLATVARFGLYLHAGEYDVSEWREFILPDCLDLIGKMIAPLTAGYAKTSLYHGLFRDHARSIRDPIKTMAGGGDAIRRHGAWDAWRAAYPELWGRWQARWLGSNAE
jgi:hypothetical protein